MNMSPALQTRLATIVADTLTAHGVVRGDFAEVFRFTWADNLPNDTAASLRLSMSYNSVVSPYGDCMYANRPYAVLAFPLWGIPTTMTLPFPLDERGMIRHVDLYSRDYSPSGIVDLVADFRKGPSPFGPEAKGVGSGSLEIKYYGPNCEHGGWSASGRVIATVNQWLKTYGFQPLPTVVGNTMLDKMTAAIEDGRVKVQWWDGPISQAYNENGSVPYTSCMAGRPTEYFELYDDLQDDGKLRLLWVTENEGEHIGRALVWCGENPPDMYLDRIYAPSARNSSDPRADVVAAIAAFCKAESITKAVYHQSSRLIPDLIGVTRFRIQHRKGWEAYEHAPYVDSLDSFSADGWLSTYGYGSNCVEMNNTDGTHSGGDLVTLHDGSRVHEDDARWVSRYDEHYHVDEVSYSDYLGEYVLDDEARYLYDGTVVWHDCDDVVELRNGDYAFLDDTVELHDGSYLLSSSRNLVQLASGEWASRRDDLVEVDGEWYLSGTEPQPEPEPEPEGDGNGDGGGDAPTGKFVLQTYGTIEPFEQI